MPNFLLKFRGKLRFIWVPEAGFYKIYHMMRRTKLSEFRCPVFILLVLVRARLVQVQIQMESYADNILDWETPS